MRTRKQIQSDARRLFRLCLSDGLMDETRVRQVAAALRKARGRDRVALLQAFRQRVALAIRRRTATVQSAAPLPEALQNRLRSDLERLYGRGLRASFAQEPKLLGGLRIRVGSDIYDGSVQGRLAALAARF